MLPGVSAAAALALAKMQAPGRAENMRPIAAAGAIVDAATAPRRGVARPQGPGPAPEAAAAAPRRRSPDRPRASGDSPATHALRVGRPAAAACARAGQPFSSLFSSTDGELCLARCRCGPVADDSTAMGCASDPGRGFHQRFVLAAVAARARDAREHDRALCSAIMETDYSPRRAPRSRPRRPRPASSRNKRPPSP